MNSPEKTPPAWQEFISRVAADWPANRWRDLGIVVGCSGGADSVGLLRALSDVRQVGGIPPRGFVVTAHFNHALRGEESDGDERFVAELARELHLKFVSARSESSATDESTLRTQRLQFLVDVAKQMGARYIALAHSADDNVETVLHHLMRGTGPAGLAGIGDLRPIDTDLVLVRPLLTVRRNQIRAALTAISQTWREDSSNAETHYRRNWIRHRLIPLIESEYPQAVGAIGRAIEGQREWRGLIDQMAIDWIAEHQVNTSPLTLRRDLYTATPVVIAAVQRLFAELDWPRGEMTRVHWLRLANTIGSELDERYTLPSQIDIHASGHDVVLTRRERSKTSLTASSSRTPV